MTKYRNKDQQLMLELCSEPTFYNPGNMCFFMVLHSEKPVKRGLGLKKKCSGRKKRELSWVSGLPKHTLKCWEIVNVTFFWCRSNIITKYNIKYYIYCMDSSNIYLGQDIKMMGKLLRQDWLRGCTVARRNPAMTKGGQSRKFRIANDSACLWLPVERARRGTATPPRPGHRHRSVPWHPSKWRRLSFINLLIKSIQL